MAWIIGIGIALFLLFSFPRQMFIMLGVLVLGGAFSFERIRIYFMRKA